MCSWNRASYNLNQDFRESILKLYISSVIRSDNVYSIGGGGGSLIDCDSNQELPCSRPCLLHCLLSPCTSLGYLFSICLASTSDSITTMGHNKIKRIFLLALGLSTFMLGKFLNVHLSLFYLVYLLFTLLVLDVCKLILTKRF